MSEYRRLFPGHGQYDPLHLDQLAPGVSAAALHAKLAETYAGERFVRVLAMNDMAPLERGAYLRPDSLANSNDLEIMVFANEAQRQALLVTRLDNLGKGASGAAVQNLNIALGLNEAAGVSLAAPAEPPTDRIASRRAVDLGEDAFGDAVAFNTHRRPGVTGDLFDDRGQLFAGHPIGQGAAKMQFPFVHTVQRGQHGDVKHAALFVAEGVIGPHRAPTIFRQISLEITCERAGVEGPVDILIAQHAFALANPFSYNSLAISAVLHG